MGFKNLVLGIVVTLSVTGLAGCNYNDLKNVPRTPGKPTAGGPDAPFAAIDYATVKKTVIDSQCLRCHHPPEPKNGILLNTYDNVFANAAKVRHQVDSGQMPPRNALTPEQRVMILAWIDSGAPETTVVTEPQPTPVPQPGPTPVTLPTPIPTPTPGPGPVVPVSPPDFAEVSAKVFVPHCVKCHSNQEAKGKVNLESFSIAKSFGSEIQMALDTDDMPRRAPALDPALKKIVYDWIDAGMPEINPPSQQPAPNTGDENENENEYD